MRPLSPFQPAPKVGAALWGSAPPDPSVTWTHNLLLKSDMLPLHHEAMPLHPFPWLWRAKSPALFCPGDTWASLCWQHPLAPTGPSTSLSFHMPFARHVWNTHPQDSCWQTPREALNRVGVGGPPTAAKLHKIPVILLALPSLLQMSHRTKWSKQATVSKGFSLKSTFAKDLCFRQGSARFFLPAKTAKESDFHTLGCLYYCHCSLIQTLLLEHISFILHMMSPGVTPHICRNPHIFCNCSAFH